MNAKKKKVWIIVVSALFTIFVLLPAVAVGIVKWFVLPPEKLTPIVLHYVRPLVNGQVEIDRIELSFWNTFPRVGLNMTGGKIISYACRDSLGVDTVAGALSDTLLSFSAATASVHIMDYLRRDRVTVDKLLLDEPFIYGLIDEKGRMNWDVLRSVEEDADGEEDADIPLIDIQRIGIRGGHFIYEDRPGGMYTEVAGFNLRMRNRLRKGNLNIDIKTGFNSLIFDNPAYTLENDLSLAFEGKLDLYHGRAQFTGARLELNGHPFTAEGGVEKQGENLLLDILFSMKVDNLAELLAFVPEEYLQNKKKISTKGSLSVEGRIDGVLGEGSAPDIRLLAVVDKAALKTRGSAHGIDKLDAEVGMYLNGNHPDSSVVSFRRLDMAGTNTSFTASGRVTHALTDPYIDAKLNGRVDFEGMLKDIINPDSFVVKGALETDIETAFRLTELADGDFSRVRAAGRFDVERLVVADRTAGLSLFARGLHFSADTTTQQSSFLTNDDLVSAQLRADTVSIRIGRDINTRLGRLDVSAKTSRTIDTTAVVPVSTHIKVANMTARLPDSVWVAGNNIYLRGGIKSSESDRKKGVFGGIVTMDTLRYIDIPARTRGSLVASSFDLQVLPRRDAVRRQRAVSAAGSGGGSDSLRAVREPGALRNRPGEGAPGRPADDRIRSRDIAGGAPTDETTAAGTQNPEGATGLLRGWEVKGSVSFASMRMFTGMFPLPVIMTGTTLKFDTDKINLSNARINIGKSDFLITGEINSMRRAMLQGGTLKGVLTLSSDYIDCNQLMRAISQSTLLAENGPAAGAGPADEEELVRLMESDSPDTEPEPDVEEGLFVVPANLDLVLKANARKVDMPDVTLENINGEIVVRNQSVNIRRLKVESEVGSGNVTMVYTARERDKATAAFELELEDIIVERLIGMFPSIDSLLPMLRSFEGVLDCQMTAMCELDSMMNVVLPSLETACYLSGENMVLMDGETFAEISKKLMFKNKERNLIDYVSVDLHIKDNKVEVYPFLVELDRYKLAVGGVHNLDMTFDYHISVLKSPVPFKLGIDITGDLDDFKFRIVKCRYKQLFKVAREEELQATRLNLRSAIRESIASHLVANAPELGGGETHRSIRSRRPEAAVTDMDEDPEESDEAASGEEPGEADGTTGEERETVTEIDEPDSDTASLTGSLPFVAATDEAEVTGDEAPVE